MLVFRFNISNYNGKQSIDYEEKGDGKTTIGLIKAQKNALNYFREQYPQNEDPEELLKISRRLIRI